VFRFNLLLVIGLKKKYHRRAIDVHFVEGQKEDKYKKKKKIDVLCLVVLHINIKQLFFSSYISLHLSAIKKTRRKKKGTLLNPVILFSEDYLSS